MSANERNYPLSGITVIDLSHVYNGPYATFLMAMAGATVIKVEPLHGEHLRSRGDMGGAALPFAMLNSNKKPVTLNLKSRDRPSSCSREMVARADILVENFAPGVMDRLGLGAADAAQDQPAADLRLELGLRQGRPVSRLSGDGPGDAGDVRRHQFDRFPGPAAGQVRRGAVRFHAPASTFTPPS